MLYPKGYKIKDSNFTGESKYFFQFSNSEKICINDPSNKILKSYGNKPDKISMKNNVREIYFSKGATLATDSESIKVYDGIVILGGYQGIKSTDLSYSVNAKGEFVNDSWHGG